MVISDPVIQADEKWTVVQRIAAAELFEKAPRLRKFFLYVAECSIAERVEDAREAAIADHVFGRNPYDSAQDGIVRTEARNLRKRLDTYFQTEGRNESIIVEMPKGGYLLSFRWREQEQDTPVPVAVPELTTISAHHRAARFSPNKILLPAVLPLVALALLWTWRDARTRKAYGASGEARLLPFSALFSDAKETAIITSDVTLVPAALAHGQRLNLDDYLARTYVPPKGSLFSPELSMKGEYTDAQEMAAAALLIQTYSRHAAQIFLRSARQIQLADLHDRSLILLGSAFSNPWVEMFEGKSYFRIEQNANEGGIFVRNLHPERGESAAYPAYDRNISYADALFLPTASGVGDVLLLSGTTAEASAGAAAFVSNEKEMNTALTRIGIAPGGPPHYFELLLRIKTYVGGATSCEVVASRSRPPA